MNGACALSFVSIRNHSTASDYPAIGNNSRAICDPLAIRRRHPEHWMAFLRAHFPDVMTVKWTFGVDYKTASNWWNGKFGPQGWAVEVAIKTVPNAAKWLEAA